MNIEIKTKEQKEYFTRDFLKGIQFATQLYSVKQTPKESETLIIKDEQNMFQIGYYRNGIYCTNNGTLINAIGWRPIEYTMTTNDLIDNFIDVFIGNK